MSVGKVFINNRWEEPATGETIPVIDPSTGEVFTQIARGTAPDVDRAIAAARAAFRRTVGQNAGVRAWPLAA